MSKWYSELLKDPRWQRKRLEVMSAKDFTCEQCGANDKTLHVHHMYYERGFKPWEYPNDALRVLCEDCHDTIGATQKELAQACAHLTHAQIELLIGVAKIFVIVQGRRVQPSSVLQEGGMAVMLGLTIDQLREWANEDGWYGFRVGTWDMVTTAVASRLSALEGGGS